MRKKTFLNEPHYSALLIIFLLRVSSVLAADQQPFDHNQPAVTLPEVIVEDSAVTPSDVREDYVANGSRTATKTDTPLMESPQAISVVTEQELIDRGVQTLQEAMRYTAGVTADSYGLDNRGDWLFIRGTEHIEYYVSYSQSFNPELGTDRFNTNFKPKRGEQYEVGLRYQPESSNSYLRLSAYDLTETNRLTSDPQNPLFSVQKSNAHVWGLEFEAVANIMDNLDLITNYAYTDATTRDNLAGITANIAEVHPHVGSLWSTYKFSIGDISGFTVGGGIRYIGANHDESGKLNVPAVTLFDVMMAYENKSWRIAFNANNLTDESYFSTCLSRGDCWYGSRGSFVGSLSHKF